LSTTPPPTTTTPPNLPTLTIVESETTFTIIATDHPFQTKHGATTRINQPAVIDYCLSWQQAFDRAHAFLYVCNGATLDPSMQVTLIALDPTAIPTTTARSSARAILTYDNTRIYISERAWNQLCKDRDHYGYKGKAAWQGMTKYLLALMSANPNHEHWQDTRPHDLRIMDAAQISHSRLPIWSFAYLDTTNHPLGHRRRQQRNLNSKDFATIVTQALPIADHFLIAPYRNGAIAPHTRVAAMLEAIGMGYLTPKYAPPSMPATLQAKPQRRPSRNNPSGLAL
jgi:hypothetical protein